MELFNHLVDRGADPSRSLALHYVCKCKDPQKAVEMLSTLLDKHGMNIYADTDDLRKFFHSAKDSGTPLCSAVYYQNLVVVEELLRRGANPQVSGAAGNAPVAIAVGGYSSEGFLPALQPLLDAGADPTPALECAVTKAMIEVVETCLKYGADCRVGLEVAHRIETERLYRVASDPSEKNQEELQADEVAKLKSTSMITFLEKWGRPTV